MSLSTQQKGGKNDCSVLKERYYFCRKAKHAIWPRDEDLEKDQNVQLVKAWKWSTRTASKKLCKTKGKNRERAFLLYYSCWFHRQFKTSVRNIRICILGNGNNVYSAPPF